MKKIFILIIQIYCISQLMGQQQASWSSFYENGFVWNPALTARWNFWEVSATQRQEWSGFLNAPQSQTVGFQFPILRRQTRSVFGTYIARDQVGPYSSITASGMYAYKIRPKIFDNYNDVLTMGFGAKIQQMVYKADELTPFDGIEADTDLFTQRFDRVSPNLSFGIFYNSVSDFDDFKSHYYMGLSLNNLVPTQNVNTPLGEITNSPHAYAHGGYRYFPWRKAYFMENSLFVSYAFARAVHVMYNFRFEMVDQYWVSAGVVSNGEAFAQAGLVFDEDSVLKSIANGGLIKIGIKVDYSLGKIRSYAGMGYEMYLAYLFEMD